MALWLVRAGKYGEHEERFFSTGCILLTWGGLEDTNLAPAKDFKGIRAIVENAYAENTTARNSNYSAQISAFVLGMKPGDLVITPRKGKPAIAIGEIEDGYQFNKKADKDGRHSRPVKWLATDVPRSAFDQDLLYSFGAIMTICEIRRNDAEKRVRTMIKNGFKAAAKPPMTIPKSDDGAETEGDGQMADLEVIARDQIAKLIIQRFKGHALEKLVEAILKAQGYTTYHSPEGPDKGIDILAAPGPLGFGRPRICVQVKSSDGPVDSPTLHQLIGSMQNVQADQGLLVSWGGFRSSVDKEVPTQFFRVRLWNQDDLVRELLGVYDKLDEDLRAELPLKRIWTLAVQDEGE